jgi:hypothetical protein
LLYTKIRNCYKRPEYHSIAFESARDKHPKAKEARRKMTVSRKLGILVFTGVPAIIGGGIVYAIFNDLTAVAIYELLLLLGVGAFIAR